MVITELKDFTLINGELYFRGGGGLFARAISKAEDKEELKHIHDLPDGENDISLYRLF